MAYALTQDKRAQRRGLIPKAAYLLGFFLSLLLTFRSADAAAGADDTTQSGPRFVELYQQARTAYLEARYIEAVEALTAAYALQAEPRILFNIAQAYRKAGEAVRARQYFAQYLEADKNISAEKKAEVDGYLSELSATSSGPAEVASNSAALPRVLLSAPPIRLESGTGKTESVVRSRWSQILGALLITGGAGLLGSGAAFFALDGRCTQEPVFPSVECGRVYEMTTPGATQVGVAGALLVSGVLSLVVPYVHAKQAAHRSPARQHPLKLALHLATK